MKREKPTEMPKLPEEIVVDIISRLPVKSLVRFRCVCKPWNSLITSNHFINLHLNRRTNDPNNETNHSLFILAKDPAEYQLQYNSLDLTQASPNDIVAPTRLDFPLVEEENIHDVPVLNIVGSCDGLILLRVFDEEEDENEYEDAEAVEEEETLFLLNPSTRECRKLPSSPFVVAPTVQSDICGAALYGFGHDSSGDDYKVVKIFHFNRLLFGMHDPVACVYNLSSDAWRVIGPSPYFHHNSTDGVAGTLLNGVIHWIDCRRSSVGYPVIASFELSNETFRDVPLPRSIENVYKHVLGVLQGCLCLILKSNHDVLAVSHDIWVMKEYGVQESWTKIRVLSQRSSLEFLCFSRRCLVMLKEVRGGEKLVLYDIERKTSKDVVVNGNPIVQAAAYVESLVSLNSGDAIEGSPNPSDASEGSPNSSDASGGSPSPSDAIEGSH